MYSAELATQPEDKPSLNDVMFKSAFPDADLKKITKELKRKAEDLFEPFYEGWSKRVEAAIKERLATDMNPELITQSVPFITRDELGQLMDLIDEFMPGDEPQKVALRITDLHNHYKDCMILATEMLQRLYAQDQTNKQATKIITPGTPGLVGLDGSTPLRPS
jgi:hypothetical protein